MFQSIPHNQPLWCCDYSPCGNLVAAAGTGKCIFMYDTGSSQSGNMELRLRIQGEISFCKKIDFYHVNIFCVCNLMNDT